MTIARTARTLLPKDSFGRLLASTERTRDKVLSVAASQGVKLTEHATVMKRVGPAVGRVNDALRLANGRGELAWYNRAYRLYRLQKAERGGPILSYQKARVRLRCAMLRRLVLVHRLEYGPEMLEEVFAGD
jgi:hypothetical protein